MKANTIMPAGADQHIGPRTAGSFALPATRSRDQSLDALRGLAILAMVLSGSIAFGGVLPAWMYHAQVPPPLHKFDPSIPGITWVDLVFPFFLFSMGAAIPLSLSRFGEGRGLAVAWVGLRRSLLLAFFALFMFHMRAWVIAEAPRAEHYLLSLLAFALLFFQFWAPPAGQYHQLFTGLRVLAFAGAVVLLAVLPFHKGQGFLLEKSDIILLVLGNMAFFGTVAWYFTRRRPLVRLAILPLVLAVFLGSKTPGSWNEALFNWSPFPWLYKFYYLKYLFIILPGTLAGDWLLRSAAKVGKAHTESEGGSMLIGILSFGIIVTNVVLLFARQPLLNLCISTALLGALFFYAQKRLNGLQQDFLKAGAYLLVLGLFLEACEGGIKKDPSTYSYYFVTSGLAFLMLIALNAVQAFSPGRGIVGFLAANGRNPMVAYVAGSLLLLPLLHLTGLIRSWEALSSGPGAGFLKGLLFTACVSAVTLLFTRKKWYWKT
jgi:predicted acyltransferase